MDSHQSLSLPCVIPQTRGSRNAFTSTFVRAYAPELASHGISKSDFVTFIDGLNEAFVGSPVFQGTNLVGLILSQFYGMHPVQLAGGIVQLASGFASAGVSYGRTRMYVKAMNERLFNPAGLHLNVLSTEKMLKHIGFPEASFPQLPSSFDSTNTPNLDPETEQPLPAPSAAEDNISRRMQALDGYCASLDYDVPANVKPDNLLKRMGNAQAEKMTRKQEKKMEKEYRKAEKDERKTDRKIEKQRRKAEEKMSDNGRDIMERRRSIDRIEAKIAAEQEKLTQRVDAAKAQGDSEAIDGAHKAYNRKIKDLDKDLEKANKEFEKERAKSNEDGEKKNRKADKKVKKEEGKGKRAKMERKEQKGVKKMRWLVVSRVEDGKSESEDSLSAAEEEGEDGERNGDAVEMKA